MVRLKHIKHYIRVKSVNEALEILDGKKENSSLIAGATSLTFGKPLSRIDTLVDITFCGLNYLKLQKDKLCLGATITLSEIAESEEAGKLFDGILRKAIYSTASSSLRNLITIGGNVVGVFSWSTQPLVLSLLEARMIFQSSSGIRTENAVELFSQSPGEWIKPAEILAEIQIPLPQVNNSFCTFKKFSRTATEFAWINAGVKLEFEPGTNAIKNTRLIVGAVSPLPQQLKKTAELLNGNQLNDQLIEEAAFTASEEARINKDLRCGKEYKREILVVILREMLTEILNARMQQLTRASCKKE